MTARLLIACVGNIFLGDDGFGSAVASELARREVPDGVRLEDYGIRSVHLVYDLLDGYDVLVLVDTVGHQDGPPGSLYVIEPDLSEVPEDPMLDPHDLPPGGALALIGVLDGQAPRIIVVGVKPESLAAGIGLSDAVTAAVALAAELVLEVTQAELARIGEGVST